MSTSKTTLDLRNTYKDLVGKRVKFKGVDDWGQMQEGEAICWCISCSDEMGFAFYINEFGFKSWINNPEYIQQAK